eukprot:636150-Pleurochrysis_carterae.AAC.1
MWKGCAPTRFKAHGVLREPYILRFLQVSIAMTLMIYFAIHYGGSAQAMQRVETASTITYEVKVEDAQKVTELCSCEDEGLGKCACAVEEWRS